MELGVILLSDLQTTSALWCSRTPNTSRPKVSPDRASTTYRGNAARWPAGWPRPLCSAQ
jgi:hypothetical protein